MIYYLQTNLFSLIILGIVYTEIKKSNVDHKLNQFLFRALILSTSLLLIIELLLNLLNGIVYQNSVFWLTIVTLMLFLLNPLPTIIWVLFTEKWLDRSNELSKMTLFYVFAPYLIHIVATIMSIKNGMMFKISEYGVYERGPFYIVMVILMISYLFYSSIRVISKRKMLSQKEFYYLVLFPVPSLIGGLIQTMFFGVVLLWQAVSIAILVVFIKLQNVDIYVDYLTGLWNRRKLHQYIESISSDNFLNQIMGGVMTDVDNFKDINDQYGHIVGDKVLADIANILKQTFNKNDFIGRYGGDEFVVILKVQSKDDLLSCITRLRKNIKQYNVSSEHEFDVRLSIGYEIMDSLAKFNFDHYLAILDKKMYRNKLQKR